MIQLAWLWLRYQPGSELAEWFRERVGTLAGRTRRIAIVAMARKLLIALWRYVESGVVPAGVAIRAQLARSLHRAARNCRRLRRSDGNTGSTTVFFIGGSIRSPRFRWVVSHWGYASCMRHYGTGPIDWPDRM